MRYIRLSMRDIANFTFGKPEYDDLDAYGFIANDKGMEVFFNNPKLRRSVTLGVVIFDEWGSVDRFLSDESTLDLE